MSGALKDLALEIRKFLVDELGKLPLLPLGWSQLFAHMDLLLMLPNCIAHLAFTGAKVRATNQLK